MKRTKLGMKLAGVVLFAGILGAGSAYAGANCLSTNITEVGVYPYLPDTTKYIVFATCDDTTVWSGEHKFFIANDGYAASHYAAALTAVATKNKVNLSVTSPNDYGVVKMLRLKALP